MKIVNVAGIVIITAIISIGGTYLYMENRQQDEPIIEAEAIEITNEPVETEEFVSTVDKTHGWEDVNYSRWLDEWTTGTEPLSESMIQELIQEMAHQKIIANEKEHSIMITPERIDILKRVITENKEQYEYVDDYLAILNRWGNGDFSTVDYDHNVVMYRQHSKDIEGLAKGIATKEQEINYIFRVFSKEVEEVFGSSEKQ